MTVVEDVAQAGRRGRPPAPLHRALGALTSGLPIVLTGGAGAGQVACSTVVVPAQLVTPDLLQELHRTAHSQAAVALSRSGADRLRVAISAPLTPGRTTAVSVDTAGYEDGATATGRARTIQQLADPASMPASLKRPGHVQILLTNDKGIFSEPTPADAAVDLCRLAGFEPVAAVCAVLDENGNPAPAREVERLADEHSIPLLSVSDVIRHLLRRMQLVERMVETTLPTRSGTFRAIGFRSPLDGRDHLALVMGDVGAGDAVFTRVQKRCLAGDVFRSLSCRCAGDLQEALDRIAREGRGAVVYLDAGGSGRDDHERTELDECIASQILQELNANLNQSETDGLPRRGT